MVGGVRPNFDDRMREADRLKVRMDVCNGCVRGERMEKKKKKKKKEAEILQQFILRDYEVLSSNA